MNIWRDIFKGNNEGNCQKCDLKILSSDFYILNEQIVCITCLRNENRYSKIAKKLL